LLVHEIAFRVDLCCVFKIGAKVGLEAPRIAPPNFKPQFCIAYSLLGGSDGTLLSCDFGGGSSRTVDCIPLLVWRKMSISHRHLDSRMIRHSGGGMKIDTGFYQPNGYAEKPPRLSRRGF
jgi:hypothetical protein